MVTAYPQVEHVRPKRAAVSGRRLRMRSAKISKKRRGYHDQTLPIILRDRLSDDHRPFLGRYRRRPLGYFIVAETTRFVGRGIGRGGRESAEVEKPANQFA